MTLEEALDRMVASYMRYYDVMREDTAPFSAKAEFHAHGESYLLFKEAKMWEMDSNEYVYFYVAESPDAETVKDLIETAWEDAVSRVTPGKNHRNSDVTFLLAADTLPPETRKLVKRTNRSKGYAHGFQGWSNLKLGAFELSTGKPATNRHGADLKKLLQNIFLR